MKDRLPTPLTLLVKPKLDKILILLRLLNEEEQKSYFTARYRNFLLTHEKRLAIARRNLRSEINNLKNLKHPKTKELKKELKEIIQAFDQSSLDIISLGCLRFRLGDDAEALSLKNKLLKFSSLLSSTFGELLEYSDLDYSHSARLLKLLKNQCQVLEDAFYDAYPFNQNHEEISFSLDLIHPEFEENPASFRYDDAHSALEAFIYTAKITCQNIETLANALGPWRKSGKNLGNIMKQDHGRRP